MLGNMRAIGAAVTRKTRLVRVARWEGAAARGVCWGFPASTRLVVEARCEVSWRCETIRILLRKRVHVDIVDWCCWGRHLGCNRSIWPPVSVQGRISESWNELNSDRLLGSERLGLPDFKHEVGELCGDRSGQTSNKEASYDNNERSRSGMEGNVTTEGWTITKSSRQLDVRRHRAMEVGGRGWDVAKALWWHGIPPSGDRLLLPRQILRSS